MRWKWILVSAVFLVIALMVSTYAVLASYDYNKLKPEIVRMVKDVTGRELEVGGNVDLTIGFPLALVVTDVAFANAPWGSQSRMINHQSEAQCRDSHWSGFR